MSEQVTNQQLVDELRNSPSCNVAINLLQYRYAAAKERLVSHGGDIERGQALELKKLLNLLTE